MKTAVVIHPGKGKDFDEKIYGLSLLERAVAVITDFIGTDRVYVPVLDTRRQFRNISVIPEEPEIYDRIILMDPAFVCDRKLLKNFLNNFDKTVVGCDENSLEPVGFAVLKSEDVEKDFFSNPWESVSILADEQKNIRIAMLSRRWCYILDKTDVNEAEKLILSNLVCDKDGIVSKNFNRVFSLFITRLTSYLKIYPFIWTLISMAMGFLGAWFVFKGSKFMGFLFFQLSAVISGVDGETARLHVRTSKFGMWFNVIANDLVLWSLFLTITYFSVQNAFLYRSGELLSWIFPVFVLLKYAGAIRFSLKPENEGLVFSKAFSNSKKNKLSEIVIPLMKRDSVIFLAFILSFLGLSGLIIPFYLIFLFSLSGTVFHKLTSRRRDA